MPLKFQKQFKKNEAAAVSTLQVIQIFVGLGFVTAIIILGALQLIPEFLFMAAVAFAWLAFL